MRDPKSRHLGTIAQLCRAISLQLRHVSTIGKKLVEQQCLLRMLSSYTNFPYRLFVRINPLPSKSRLRCCDRYIRCHRLLAVKPLSPRQHAGRRVGKGGTLGSVDRHGRLDSTETAVVTVAAKDNRSLQYRPVELGRYPLFEIE